MALVGGESSVQSAAFAALLVDSGLISEDQLRIARAAKAKTGLRIDEILINLGMVKADALLKVMARAWKLAPIDLDSTRVDFDLVRHWPGELYLEQNWVPVHDQSNGSVLVATARVPDAERASAIANVLESPVEFVAATSWDIRRTVLRGFRAEIDGDASTDRWRTNPSLSARVVLSKAQVTGGILGGLALLALAIAWPAALGAAVVTIAGAAYAGTTTFMLVLAVRGGTRRSAPPVAAQRQPDEVLPFYTVLVPVFRQAHAVPGMIASLSRLDYPVDRLEVLVLVEEEDRLTRDAIVRAEAPERFRIVSVPGGAPETRPRACNVGLFAARGEFLVVYGAEHEPAPDQLRRAIDTFAGGAADLVCVQASVDYSNAQRNTVTRLIALEQSAWAERVLPGIERSRLAVPAGGTSNHFRTTALIELGGWDPYNVSESVDLGIRASAVGYRVSPMDSITVERAAASVPALIRQRSRWLKGDLQTAFVHARQPVALIRRVGIARFLGTALLVVASPAVFLAVIPFYLLIAIALAVPGDVVATVVPAWALQAGIVLFVAGTIEMIVTAIGPVKRKVRGAATLCLLLPVYWILHSVAAYKALGQLFTRPHYWEKTDREPAPVLPATA